MTFIYFYLNVGTLGQTPCGPNLVGQCDATGECKNNEVQCPAGGKDCIFIGSVCCVKGTTVPEDC